MGCGQSHIAVIYPRKAKGKSAHGSGGSDDSEDEGEGGGGQLGGEPPQNTTAEEEDSSDTKLSQMVHISSSPLLAQTELSTSQYDFFKMLDDKINNGPDYHANCEFEFGMEDSRLSRFLQEWESAKQRSVWCGGSTPVRKLQRYHSVQSNGDVQQRGKQLHHQMSQGHYPPAPPPAHYVGGPYYPPPHIPVHYQYHHRHYPPQYALSNSVVMYDKSRGGYYTELA